MTKEKHSYIAGTTATKHWIIVDTKVSGVKDATPKSHKVELPIAIDLVCDTLQMRNGVSQKALE